MDNEQQARIDQLMARRGAAGGTTRTAKPESKTIAQAPVEPSPFEVTGWSVGASRVAADSPFSAPDPATLVRSDFAIGAADPLGDLQRVRRVAKADRAKRGRRRPHAAGAGRILAAGLSTSAFFVGIASLASANAAKSTAAPPTTVAEPATTQAPVIIERDVFVDEDGNEIPSPEVVKRTTSSISDTTIAAVEASTTTVASVPLDPMVAGADGLPVAEEPASTTAAPAAPVVTVAKKPVATVAKTAAPAPATTKAPAPAAVSPVTAAPVAAAAPATAAPVTAAPTTAAPKPTAAPVTAAPTTAAPKPTVAPTTAPPMPATTGKPACTGSKC